jgi:hypothetical protein
MLGWSTPEILDLRQQQSLNQWSAHRSSVRALAVDEASGRFFTGSAEGEIKVCEC